MKVNEIISRKCKEKKTRKSLWCCKQVSPANLKFWNKTLLCIWLKFLEAVPETREFYFNLQCDSSLGKIATFDDQFAPHHIKFSVLLR